MRKNSPRKWLHAILDLLPVIILPIFALAVRSDNNFQPIEIQVGEQVQKINYKYQSNEVNDYDDLIIGNVYHLESLDLLDSSLLTNGLTFYILTYQTFNIDADDFYIDETVVEPYNSSIDNYLLININPDYSGGVSFTNEKCYLDIWTDNGFTQLYLEDFDFILFNNDLKNGLRNSDYLPSKSDFNIIESVTTEGELVTYNDTDVGSQMVYTLYNATDKYFNMNGVFNLNSMWSWIQLNIFNGNTPLIAYVIWQIIIYEFIVDIIFIFYAFFMFLIDFCECLLEKPFNKINRGK